MDRQRRKAAADRMKGGSTDRRKVCHGSTELAEVRGTEGTARLSSPKSEENLEEWVVIGWVGWMEVVRRVRGSL